MLKCPTKTISGFTQYLRDDRVREAFYEGHRHPQTMYSHYKELGKMESRRKPKDDDNVESNAGSDDDLSDGGGEGSGDGEDAM